MTSVTLKTVIFFGSARNVTPPWGGEKRLGDRLLSHVKSILSVRSTYINDVTVTHDVTCFDPLVVFGEGGALAHSGAHLTAPTFFQKSDDLPEATKAMMESIKAADCILCVSPEYNHGVPPALASMLDHFGGSCYKAKPSGIISYSAGPWGGTRAAMPLQYMLHELGALPVSKMAHFPSVSDMFKEDGELVDPGHRMAKQLPDLLVQLEWMAIAMKNMRDTSGVF